MRFLLVALCTLACTPSFESASQVLDLRVLAIQTDPPEAQYDDTHVEAVRVRILAVDPARNTPIQVTARGCFPTDSRRCDAGVLFNAGTVGTDFTITGIPQSVLQAALQDDRLKGLNGIPLQMEFSVYDGDPHEPVVAEKVAIFSKLGSRVPNHLPLLERIELSRNGQPLGSVAPGDALTLPVGAEIGLRPVLAPGSREQYVTTDLNGVEVTLTEQPRYWFYASGPSDIDRDTADEPLDGVAPSDGLSRLTALRAGSGKLWVVVRDGRGGESWIEVPWTGI